MLVFVYLILDIRFSNSYEPNTFPHLIFLVIITSLLACLLILTYRTTLPCSCLSFVLSVLPSATIIIRIVDSTFYLGPDFIISFYLPFILSSLF